MFATTWKKAAWREGLDHPAGAKSRLITTRANKSYSAWCRGGEDRMEQAKGVLGQGRDGSGQGRGRGGLLTPVQGLEVLHRAEKQS